jgi:hypothetical protein
LNWQATPGVPGLRRDESRPISVDRIAPGRGVMRHRHLATRASSPQHHVADHHLATWRQRSSAARPISTAG